MEEMPYIVYVRPDEKNRITAVSSSAFLSDTEGWTEIDRGTTPRHRHAQGNYFPQPVMDERGVWRYKLKDGVPVERTAEEMDADYVPPAHVPSDAERINALEAAMTAIEEGIASV